MKRIVISLLALGVLQLPDPASAGKITGSIRGSLTIFNKHPSSPTLQRIAGRFSGAGKHSPSGKSGSARNGSINSVQLTRTPRSTVLGPYRAVVTFQIRVSGIGSTTVTRVTTIRVRKKRIVTQFGTLNLKSKVRPRAKKQTVRGSGKLAVRTPF